MVFGWEQNYTPTQNGNYTVIVSDTNYCRVTSAPFNYTEVGIEEVDIINRISISPNPSNGKFTMDLRNIKADNYSIIISDVLGQVVQSINTAYNGLIEIDGTALKSGIYFFRVMNSKGIAGNGKFSVE